MITDIAKSDSPGMGTVLPRQAILLIHIGLKNLAPVIPRSTNDLVRSEGRMSRITRKELQLFRELSKDILWNPDSLFQKPLCPLERKEAQNLFFLFCLISRVRSFTDSNRLTRPSSKS